MSFSSEVKQQLSLVAAKKSCCREACASGMALARLDERCPSDRGCFLRGLFISRGFVSPPGRNFMLTISFAENTYADYIGGLLSEAGLPPKLTLRKGKPILYYKESESIEDFLSYIGATKIALEIISEKVIHDVRNNANRLCNAETANLDRMARAAAEQCEAIRRLEKRGTLRSLPAELRECAEIRLKNPDMSLDELRVLLKNPISKSGLNHRYRRIIEIAEMSDML